MASITQSRWVPDQTHLLMPQSETPGTPGLGLSDTYCNSWRFSVETNNTVGWSVVPQSCAEYVGKYMKSDQYYDDCDFVVDEAIKYVDSLKLTAKDTWVFDIDETALSNLPYYARPEVAFGSKPRNLETFYKWVESATVPALSPVLRLYKHLIDKNVTIVFLTGSSDEYTKAREDNLKHVGYNTWEQLILM
ncbi:hypothetical protein LguiA_019515 [Lonicera macranthoides]